jgi:serine O-acetyltransferase
MSIRGRRSARTFSSNGTGLVIGETCRIGNRVKLYHGVTPGARSFAKHEDGKIVKVGKRHPDVRDTVTIYPNSAIGANVFLMQSVPANSLVVQQSTQLAILDKAAKAQTPEPPLEWSI